MSGAVTEYEFPVSFSQQRLWFLEQLEGAGAVYNVRLAVRLSGALDDAQLQDALDALIARHEALRTTVQAREGGPVQVVAAELRVPLEHVAVADEAALRRRVAELSSHVFDLERGPLLRVFLLRLKPGEQVLLMLAHHAIADAWSCGVLFRDLAELYAARNARRAPVLPELTVQYADFASWQRERLQGAELERQLAFWRRALTGAPPLLELPTDRARPAVQRYEGSRWTRMLSRELTSEMRAFATAEGCTPFMLLAAVYMTLLARYSGQDDIVIGTPIAGRQRTELESVVGFFANTLALRGDLSGAPTFRALLARVRKFALEAYDHQELPFEKLVEALNPPRTLSHAPVFQAMFILQNTPWDAAAIPGLTIRPAETDAVATAKYDLTLSVTEYAGELWLGFEYATALFDAVTVERMAGHYEALLRAALATPDLPAGMLPLADATSAAISVHGRDVPLDPAARVHALFEAQARVRPHDIAVECGTERRSYLELERSADALAAHLRGRDIGSGDVVAIALDRSVAMLVAMLGVLKSGAAYLPLDPAFPDRRLHYMLEDSGAALLLTQRRHATRLAGSAEVVCMDELRLPAGTEVARAARAERPAHTAHNAAESPLAYLIYTSGSTGQPKGVRITHAGGVNFLESMRHTPGIAAGERWLAVTTLSFDIAVLELFGPLIAGATVVIAARDEARDGAALAHLLEANRIDAMQATPATWRALLASGWRGRRGLRMLCGGEALDADLARRLLATGAPLWNLYGPTETTVWSACGQIEGHDDAARITVGRPLFNTQIYVLDAAGGLAPCGVPGELCIGGAGVSPGYHRREELTRERFIANPFDAACGATLYRTGDRGRVLADGRIEVLGRLDSQVKLRGFRIEAGEVESALLRCAGIAQCAVGLRGAVGNQRLVAWLVARSGAERPSSESLQSQLKAQLPGYMIPSAFVWLAALPLTPNGKLDRQALPAPSSSDMSTESGERYAAPRNAVEETLCALFAEVLGLAPQALGLHTDFFAAGGHSLLATQLVSRIRDVLEVELPLKALFECPTVAGIAGHLEQLGHRGPRVPPVLPIRPIRPHPERRSRAPLSWSQQRLWFLEQLEPGNAAYHLHAAFSIEGALDEQALERALSAIATRHEALRTRFAIEKDGDPIQIIEAEMPIRLERLSGRDEQGQLLAKEALDRRLVAHIERPFDLTTGPLWRTVLVEQGASERVLLLVMHHIVSDGWSLAILLRELGTAYAAFRRNEAPQWSALPVQYADYAEWQRTALGGAELERQLAYWKTQLDGAPTVLELPIDRPRLPLQRHRGARLTVELPAGVTHALHELARRDGCTMYMLLIAGFASLLSRYTGAEQLLIGTPIAGRSRTELEGLIGFFVNTLVLRIDLRGNPSVAELLARTRRTALDAYAHPDLPFERLVDQLAPPRDRGRTPLFQVMFNLHNELAQTLGLGDARVRRLALPRRSSKFDLTVGVVEHAQGLSATFEYDTDLFDGETVSQLGEGYTALLQDIAREPSTRRVGELEVMSVTARARAEAEQARVASVAEMTANNAAWLAVSPSIRTSMSAETVSLGTADSLGARFFAQVERNPEHVAVSWRERGAGGALRRWCYAELWARAAAVAANLRQHGAPGTPVALLLGHDGAMVAGLMGAVLAARPYVPLDPYAPRARQETLLRASGATALLTDAFHRAAGADWIEANGLPVVLVDEATAHRPNAGATATPDTTAYLLYTSGTSGEPKAVLQTHGGVLGHIGSWTAQLGITAADRLALLSGYGYDAAVQDLFGALLNGASVHALDLRGGESGPELVDRIAEEGITLLHLTPTVYRHLFGGRVTCTQDLSRVRLVVLGGEEARRSDLDLFKLRFRRGARFVNGFGLTESTTGLQYFADHDTRVLGQRLPVGRAVTGMSAQVLDADGQPSWRGELLLQAPHVALGYHDDAALTGQRFERRPDGSRRLRTADVLWRAPDGQWVSAGRADRQLKLRGIRIAPAEIEAAVLADSTIRECVVDAVEADGELRLVAWVVATALDETALRASLSAKLPQSLVPQTFVVLPELPRRANGKLARERLPPPQWSPTRSATPVPPRTELERELAALWAGVLTIEAAPLQRQSEDCQSEGQSEGQREVRSEQSNDPQLIGLHDDFFSLGGHSLLATRLIARIRDRFGVEVPLLALFESPTVAGMAKAVEGAAARTPEPDLPALRRRPRRAAAGGS